VPAAPLVALLSRRGRVPLDGAHACGLALTALLCPSVRSPRLPVVLLLAYVVFVLYGSFFPFEFAYDPKRIERVLDRPHVHVHDAEGHRLISLPDVVANLLLGVPFGLLMVGSGLGGASLTVRLGRVLALDALLASAVEVGQLFTPGRTSSLFDVAGQVTGSLIGLLVMHGLLAGSRRPLGSRLGAVFKRRPAFFVLLVLAAVLAADALYPYVVTLDVSTAWHNLKAGQWRPLGSLARTFWPDLLVEKLLAFAVVAVLGRAALESLEVRSPGPLAWAGVTAFAILLEGAKLMIVGRAPNVDTVLLAVLGGLVGVTILPALGRSPVLHTHAPALLVCGAVMLLAYEELTPFTFVDSVSALRIRVHRIEWMPFAAYYGAEPQSSLFDLGKKLVLGGLVGAAIRHASRRAPLLSALLLAALLEAAQVCQPARTASVTDVISLSVGAILGAYLVGRGQDVRASHGAPDEDARHAGVANQEAPGAGGGDDEPARIRICGRGTSTL
jgi:VanZ family protein